VLVAAWRSVVASAIASSIGVGSARRQPRGQRVACADPLAASRQLPCQLLAAAPQATVCGWPIWQCLAVGTRRQREEGADTGDARRRAPDRRAVRPPNAINHAALGSKTRFQRCQGAGGVGLETLSSGIDDRRLRPKPHCGRCRLTDNASHNRPYVLYLPCFRAAVW